MTLTMPDVLTAASDATRGVTGARKADTRNTAKSRGNATAKGDKLKREKSRDRRHNPDSDESSDDMGPA